MITPIIVPMEVAASTVEIPMEVSASTVEIPMELEVAFQLIDGDEYEGPYTVTPHFLEQSLATTGKLMTDDVTVYEIPVVRTANPYGGDTIVIG